MTLSPINAPKVLLMGASGSGKTFALRTLVEAGITPYICALDPQGMETVADVPVEKLGWHIIKPNATTWTSMIDATKRLGSLNFEGITKAADFQKGRQRRFLDTLETFASFKDDRTGASLGEIDKWGTNRAIVLDHFTELCQAAKEWAVGEKLVLHEGEWQVAQNTVENLVRQLTIVCRCWVVVIAHLDREVDIVGGGTRVMVHALGKKLAPKLPPLFSDVVLAKRVGTEFIWSTAEAETDLKTRNLPINAKLAPSFVAIAEAWKKRGGIIEKADGSLT